MSTIDMCRVCLVENLQMYRVKDTKLEDVFERLLNTKLQNASCTTLCYICLALLRRCHQFAETARESSSILEQWHLGQTDEKPRYTQHPIYTFGPTTAETYPLEDNEDDLYEDDLPLIEVKTEVNLGEVKDEDKTENLIFEGTKTSDSEKGIIEPVFSETCEPLVKKQVFVVMDDDLDQESSEDEILKVPSKIVKIEGGELKKRKLKLKQMRRQPRRVDKPKSDSKTLEKCHRILCNICNSTFATRSSFTIHYRIHTGEKPYSCNLCDYKCRRKYNLDIHSRTHNGQKPYNCHLCEYKCSIKKNLSRHMLVHTGEKPFTCDLCGKKFTQNSSLTCHKMRLHSNERPYACDTCNYNFVRKQDLEVHKTVHSSRKPSRHRRKIQNAVKNKSQKQTFLCHICDYKCSTKTVLNVHINAHNGVKPFSCDMCDFKCSWKGTLKSHMRRHTGEKPYLCHMCDFKCAQKCNLITHIRTHTGEKAYACDICDYKSTQGSHMKQHKKIHTGEKGFACTFCTYKCSYKQRLVKHVMSVHKTDVKSDLDRNTL